MYTRAVLRHNGAILGGVILLAAGSITIGVRRGLDQGALEALWALWALWKTPGG